MNNKIIFIPLALLLASVALIYSFANDTDNIRAGRVAPTPAPTATEGPPPTVEVNPTELGRPLKRKEAIKVALDYDKQSAEWEIPWSLETVERDQNRITVEWHKDQTYDGSFLGPYSERGPIWVITIKGKVRVKEDRSGKFHDGITYRIAERTGALVSVTTGPWSK